MFTNCRGWVSVPRLTSCLFPNILMGWSIISTTSGDHSVVIQQSKIRTTGKKLFRWWSSQASPRFPERAAILHSAAQTIGVIEAFGTAVDSGDQASERSSFD